MTGDRIDVLLENGARVSLEQRGGRVVLEGDGELSPVVLKAIVRFFVAVLAELEGGR